MYMLGAHLPDQQLLQHALTIFFGISRHTSARLCARLQLHRDTRVNALTDAQVTALSAYLSSPSTIPAQRAAPTSPFAGSATASSSSASSSSASASSQGQKSAKVEASMILPPSQRRTAADDPLRSMLLESDLRRNIRENIAHHRNIGTYKGRRHIQGLPVRGQRTHTNAQTAGKLNKLERKGFSTWAGQGKAGPVSSAASRPSVSSLVRTLLRPGL